MRFPGAGPRKAQILCSSPSCPIKATVLPAGCRVLAPEQRFAPRRKQSIAERASRSCTSRVLGRRGIQAISLRSSSVSGSQDDGAFRLLLSKEFLCLNTAPLRPAPSLVHLRASRTPTRPAHARIYSMVSLHVEGIPSSQGGYICSLP